MFKNTYVQTEHCIFTNANNTCILDIKHWFLYLFFIWLFYYSTPNFKLQEKFLQSKKAHQPKSMHQKMQAPICRQTKLYQTGISLREYHCILDTFTDIHLCIQTVNLIRDCIFYNSKLTA